VQLTDADGAAFVAAYPGMRLAPSNKVAGRLYTGNFHFRAGAPGRPDIEDQFKLDIWVPEGRTALPQVWEIGDRIERIPDNHISSDGSLCLGTELTLRLALGRNPELMTFIELCLIPYLAGTRWREDGNGSYINGELPHYEQGLIKDYEEILRVRGSAAIYKSLKLASLRRRVANKRACPCQCGRRLGRCDLHARVNRLRNSVDRSTLAAIADKVKQVGGLN
jgi:hypothetical protein